MRYLSYIPTNSTNHLRYYNGQKIEIVGQVSQEPEVGINGVSYIVETQNFASVQSQNFVSVQGKMLVKLPLYPRYNYGDQLQMTCYL